MGNQEITPLQRGRAFGAVAAAEDFACASCASGRLAVEDGGIDGLWLRVMPEAGERHTIPLDLDDAEFFAGIILSYVERRRRLRVEVPDIQPNSIYGEKP